MNDQDQTKQQLLDELAELRQRVAALEGVDRQRRRVEEELAKSKAILTAAMDCLPFDFYALDPTGRCMLQNAVSRQYYGSAVGKTAEQVCPDERVLPRWIEGNRRALAGQRVEVEEAWCVAGEQRQFFSIMAPIQQDGTLYGILGVNVDITQLKLIEEALRTSERRYRALAESTRDIIFILDREGSLCYANQAALQCIGISAADIVGKRQVDLFPPEMAQSQLEMIGRVFATGTVVEYDDLFQFGPEEIWLRIHLLPLRDEAGQIASVMGVCHNITDRKRAEEALRKAHDDLEVKVRQRTAELARANEELAIFHKFAEASGQGFSMADLDGRITYMNPTLCRMLGEEKPEDALGQHISAYYSQQSSRRGSEEIEPVLKQRGYWEGELPMLSRQGKSIPTWQNSFLIRDDSGNPFRLAVVITDITERKQAESKMAYLASFPERNPNPVVEVSLGGEIQYVNPAACSLFPELRDQGRLHPWLMDWDATVRPFREGRTETIFRGVTVADRNFQQSLHFLAQDQLVRVYALDITERKQAEEALRRSEEKYRMLIEACPDAVVMADPQMRIVFASPQAVRLYGAANEDAICGRTLVSFVVEQDRPRAIAGAARVFEEGVRRNSEYNFTHINGTSFPCEVSTAVVKNDGDQPVAVISIVRDISDRKRAEEAIQREQRTLEHMLQSSDHERQLIAYDIHDGLAQYLTGAIMQLDVANQIRTENPGEAAKAYDAGILMVRQSLAEARRLISGVRPPILDESGIVAAVAHLVYEHRGRSGPKIKFQSKVEFGRLEAILENAVYRIVQEGLTNAWKHSQSKKVSVELVQDGEDLRIVIEDQGIGFDPQAVGEGRFGLEGIRERARLLGGRSLIESTPGKGTRIVVELPIVLRKENDE
jgi:PAS domain S-box-containing protein